MLKFNKGFNLKIIALLVAITFTVTSTGYGIDLSTKSHLRPPFVTQMLSEKRRMIAEMYRNSRFVWIAKSEKYLNLLDRYNALALLLPSGRYLMTQKTANNDLSLIRAVTHEDYEILMQREEELHSTRYGRLMKQLLKNDEIMQLYHTLSHYKNVDDQPDNIIFNDLIAIAFELLFIKDQFLVNPDTELTDEERKFVELMRPILEARDISDRRYTNFSQVFFNVDKRTRLIMGLQQDRDVRFYRVAKTDIDLSGPIGTEMMTQSRQGVMVGEDVQVADGHELASTKLTVDDGTRIVPSIYEKFDIPRTKSMSGSIFWISAFVLGVLRAPMALPPYILKALLNKIVPSYKFVEQSYLAKGIHITGEFLQVVLIFFLSDVVFGQDIGIAHVFIYTMLFAESIKLLTQRGTILLAGIWMILPHKRFAAFLDGVFERFSIEHRLSYIEYFLMEPDEQMEFISGKLKGCCKPGSELEHVFSYLTGTGMEIVPSDHSLWAGMVRDVKNGKVFIHLVMLNLPWLVMFLVIRRGPWFFDPRNFQRPFSYHLGSYLAVTNLVFRHWQLISFMFVYQFGQLIEKVGVVVSLRFLQLFGVERDASIGTDGTADFRKIVEIGAQKREILPDVEIMARDTKEMLAEGNVLAPEEVAERYLLPPRDGEYDAAESLIAVSKQERESPYHDRDIRDEIVSSNMSTEKPVLRSHVTLTEEEILAHSIELFSIIEVQDVQFQVSGVNNSALDEVDFKRNTPIFIAQDIFHQPAGFRESWEKFGRPEISILAQDVEEAAKVNRLKAVGLIPENAKVILKGNLSGELLEEKQGILLGFGDSIPSNLPANTQKLQFSKLDEDKGEVLNWQRPFMLLSYRLGVTVDYTNLPEDRAFSQTSLGTLLLGEPIYIDIPVGVKFELFDDIHKIYRNFRDAVGGV